MPTPAKKKNVKNVKNVKKTPGLTAAERRRLLKPRESFDDLVEKIDRVWSEHRAVRVPQLTPARLRSLLTKAMRAAAREDAIRDRFAERIRPLQDRRLLADDALWKAVLDLNAAVKLHARRDPGLAHAFAFVAQALRSRAPQPAPAPAAPA